MSIFPYQTLGLRTYNFSDVAEIFQSAVIFLDSLFYSHMFWSIRRINNDFIHHKDLVIMPRNLIKPGLRKKSHEEGHFVREDGVKLDTKGKYFAELARFNP